VCGALADPAACVVVDGALIRAESCLPRSPAVPPYLRYSERDAVIVAHGPGALRDLERRLATQILVDAEGDVVDDLSAGVIVLEALTVSSASLAYGAATSISPEPAPYQPFWALPLPLGWLSPIRRPWCVS
jgi:hypothetical protein